MATYRMERLKKVDDGGEDEDRAREPQGFEGEGGLSAKERAPMG